MNEQLAEGTNRAFSHEVRTDASPEAIWTLWTDVTSWKDWDKGLKDAEIENAFTLGAQGKIIPHSGPSSRFKITEYIEGKSYAFETNLPFAKLEVRRIFVSRQPTIFRHEVRFKGLFAGVWAGRFGPGFRAALPPTMEGLAVLAEQNATGEQ